MARTLILPTNVVPQESTQLLYADADAINGMMFLNDGSCVLNVFNDGVADIDVTIIAVPDEAGRAVNYVKTVPADEEEIFGYFRQEWWNQTIGNAGFVYVDFDDDTNVKVGVINF